MKTFRSLLIMSAVIFASLLPVASQAQTATLRIGPQGAELLADAQVQISIGSPSHDCQRYHRNHNNHKKFHKHNHKCKYCKHGVYKKSCSHNPGKTFDRSRHVIRKVKKH